MKTFLACLATETNSFSPMPTGLSGFAEGIIHHGTATRDPAIYWTGALHLWRAAAEARGWPVVESLATFAQPSGPTVRKVYEDFRDEILRDLKAAMPVDIVLLQLHGAMIADGYPDCEGDLIARIREIAPTAKIGATLDPHCHLTQAMIDNATALICFKEYPHVDVLDRARELFTLLADAAEGRIHPVMRDHDCRIIMAMPTPEGPMRAFVDAMTARESEPGVLSLSLAHGFPWGDHPRTGARALAITDGDPALAERMARELAEKLWRERKDIFQQVLSIDAALDRAAGHNQGPIVLADMSDNAGGGAPSDSTFLLRAMLERGLTSIASGIYWDPGVVRLCQDAGEGATLPVRLGGKCGPMSGDPLDLTVTIRRVATGLTQRFGTLPVNLGTAVWLRIEDADIDLVVNDSRTQTFHPEAFTGLGIDLDRKRHVCVKSSNHYRAGFAPIASTIIPIASPGAITPDFTAIPYRHRALNYWPKVEDPFA
ncbi:MAG: M81 family metallopeptidase [Rhodobacter sp.]|uniref:M81 family metallopeptidase n=1 Tax=Pararhodobacter sp. TaxID=2127056 RepID=UPI002B8DCF02|nr:M81 family metallopeptidase [Pararhodobacter sp.]MCC0072311.1 M81 family metallopeptidase [Rhodobacter sp.]HPD92175.1 M81 family metallopeptidase [Pararhodobacter sp.]